MLKSLMSEMLKVPWEPREFREPGFRHLSAQLLWKFRGELRRFAETVIYPCKMTKKCCGDLRRRRFHAKTAQKNIKTLASETPYWDMFKSLMSESVPGTPSFVEIRQHAIVFESSLVFYTLLISMLKCNYDCCFVCELSAVCFNVEVLMCIDTCIHIYIYIYIYTYIHIYNKSAIIFASPHAQQKTACGCPVLRPISVLRFWISESSIQAES